MYKVKQITYAYNVYNVYKVKQENIYDLILADSLSHSENPEIANEDQSVNT